MIYIPKYNVSPEFGETRDHTTLYVTATLVSVQSDRRLARNINVHPQSAPEGKPASDDKSEVASVRLLL